MKTLIHLIPYAAFPPKGGGALRSANLALQLARFYRTKLIILQSRNSVVDSGLDIPDTLEIISPVDTPRARDLFDFIYKGAGLRYRWLRRTWEGPANSIVGQCFHIFQRMLSTQKIDAVILEHLEGMTLAPVIRRLSPKTRIILDAHNIDHLLLEQESEVQTATQKGTSKDRSKRFKQIEKVEQSLGQHVDAFWACSDKDRDVLKNLNDGLSGYTIANGVDCDAMAFRNNPNLERSAPIILFCGSLGYEANRDGLNWFASECWPLIKAALPGVRLCVIGKEGKRDDYNLLIQDSTVDFVGEVDSIVPFYQKAHISICPLRIGSGTRLKVLETLSIGTPCVSTPLGCEGIDLTDGEHVLVASDPNVFASQCIRLVNDKSLAESISQKGRRLVEEKFDWRLIGKMMNHSIEEICAP